MLAEISRPHHRNLMETHEKVKTLIAASTAIKLVICIPCYQHTTRAPRKIHHTKQCVYTQRKIKKERNWKKRPLLKAENPVSDTAAYGTSCTHEHLCMKQNKAKLRSTSKRKPTTKTHVLHPFIPGDSQSPTDTQTPHRI